MLTRTWKRRCFLRATGLAGLAPLVSPQAVAGGEDWSRTFSRSFDADPMLLGWRNVQADRLRCKARIEGRLPEELRGTFYRNGPAIFRRFGVRYRHWFEGDGMVQAFRFDDRGVSHRARVLATPKLVRETSAQRRLFSGFATPVDGGARPRRPDDLNVANTSLLDHHGELLALWKADRPACSTARPWPGRASRCGASPWTACPSPPTPRSNPTEPCGPSATASRRRRRSCSTTSPRTARFAGRIASTPVRSAWCTTSSSPPGTWSSSYRLWCSSRPRAARCCSTPSPGGPRWALVCSWWTRTISTPGAGTQLPAGFGFHHGNGWEDAGGAIRFDHCVASDATLMTETMRVIMRGEFKPAAPELYTRFTLHPDGRSEVDGDGRGSGVPPHRPPR